KRVLLPRAAVARDLVPATLTSRGAQVDVVEAYRTVAPEGLADMREVLCPPPDWITFTSSSTVRNFVAAAGAGVLPAVRAVSIGPITTETAESLGIRVAAQAEVFTVEGLVQAILSSTDNH